MDIAAIGGLLGGLGQLAGGASGLFQSGGRQPDMSFQQNWRNDEMALARAQMDMQREFAQQGIRWKVADAKAAGIHPLAALGVMPTSYSPVSVGGSYPDSSFGDRGVDVGGSLANMGQGLGRAIAATQSKEERVLTAFELKRQEQELVRGDLENQVLASKLAIAQQGLGPGMPSSVGGVAGGANPEAQILGTTTGGVTTHPSKSSKAEDEFGAPLMAEMLYRNRLLPMLGAAPPAIVVQQIKKMYPNATGAYWDYAKWDWQPTFDKSGEGRLRRYIDWRRNAAGFGPGPTGSAAPYLAP